MCDGTDKAVSERMEARAMNTRFGKAEGLVEGAMGDGTEHQQLHYMERSSWHFIKTAVSDINNKDISERIKKQKQSRNALEKLRALKKG